MSIPQLGAPVCHLCGSAVAITQSPESVRAGVQAYWVKCGTCGNKRLTTNPWVTFVDVNVPQEPQHRWRPESDGA